MIRKKVLKAKCLLTLGLLFAPLQCFGQNHEYRILDLRPSPITIGKTAVKKGDIVNGNEVIQCNNFDQEIKVEAIGSREMPHVFLAQAMNGKTMNYCWKEKGNMPVPNKNGNGNTSENNTKGVLKDSKISCEFFEGIRDTARFGKGRRIALVIGNNSYVHKNLPRLEKPIIDAIYMQNKLMHLGFDVMEVQDAIQDTLEKAVEEFFYKAQTGKYSMALIYFSGHGIRYREKDYLLPIDARLTNRKIGKYFSVDKLIEEHRKKIAPTAAGPKLIIILDACRNGVNNYENKVEHNPDPQDNEVFFFAVPPNYVALQGDDDGKPSPFTATLINGIGTGKSIFEEFRLIEDTLEANGQTTPQIIGGRKDFDECFFVK